MKYMILVYSNPRSREMWESFSPEERAEGWNAHAALLRRIADAGELVAAEALADPSRAKRVAVEDGRTLATDGPFAEVKEHLAGFYLVDCEGLERAVEHAARVPEAALGLVEVRPVMALGGTEM